jgi:hypothetical protein
MESSAPISLLDLSSAISCMIRYSVGVTDYDDDDLRKAASEAGACGYSLKQNLTELVPLLRSMSGEVD